MRNVVTKQPIKTCENPISRSLSVGSVVAFICGLTDMLYGVGS